MILAGYGGLMVAGGLALSAGVFGLVAAFIALVAAIGLTTPFALTVCILLITAIGPTVTLTVALSACGLAVIALAGFDNVNAPLQGVVLLLAATALVGGIAYLAWRAWPAWLATLSVLIVIAILGYGIHRYERVMLGLVTDDTPTAEDEL